MSMKRRDAHGFGYALRGVTRATSFVPWRAVVARRSGVAAVLRRRCRAPEKATHNTAGRAGGGCVPQVLPVRFLRISGAVSQVFARLAQPRGRGGGALSFNELSLQVGQLLRIRTDI